MARTPETHKLKMAIRSRLEDFIYSKVDARLNRRLEELIVKDAVARGDGVRGFAHRGKNYFIKGEKLNAPYFPRMSKKHRGEMDEWVKEFSLLEDEKSQVRFYIIHVLNSSDDPSRYMCMFPTALRKELPKVYATLNISVDGASFSDKEPEPNYKAAYEMLQQRLVSNLLME